VKCELFIEDELFEETIEFFKSIGMMWVKPEDLYINKPVYIEFISMPDVLRVYSMEMTPAICSISALGVSFYLCIGPNSVLKVDDDSMEVAVFCPMSNIKVINLFGNLQYKKFFPKHGNT
jgi:hypothetical protein